MHEIPQNPPCKSPCRVGEVGTSLAYIYKFKTLQLATKSSSDSSENAQDPMGLLELDFIQSKSTPKLGAPQENGSR